MLVSSANNINFNSLEQLGRSFIYIIKNNNGPRIEPWGTPHVTLNGSDNIFVYITCEFGHENNSQTKIRIIP